MNVGMIGLGKLGLPVAVALGQKYYVYGYDINPELCLKRKYEHKEAGLGKESFQSMFDSAKLSFGNLGAALGFSKIIFVAIQTPHQPKFEGITRLTDERADFDYSYLINAAHQIAGHPALSPDKIIVIISTCLPGTIRKYIAPILDGKCHVVYNPFFIAMGTVVQDFYNPEFILLGGDDKDAVTEVEKLYKDFHKKAPAAIAKMSIESAELTKVAYNTFIGMKIAYANTMMEIAQKIPGCNVDDVMGAIKLAKDRLISTKYLTPGMGDGGGCHPRDNIAMSHLAWKLGLSHDLFTDIMKAREDQAMYLVKLMLMVQNSVFIHTEKYPKIIILGKAFKPETNITTGSPAILVSNILTEKGVVHEMFDPIVDTAPDISVWPRGSIFLVATKHAEFAKYTFPTDSIVFDPHRYIPDQDGVEVVRIGEHK